jgi:hypothetical protein
MVASGDVLVADRGWCAYAPLARLVQASVHAVRRVGARQMVDFTPGPLVSRACGARLASKAGPAHAGAKRWVSMTNSSPG